MSVKNRFLLLILSAALLVTPLFSCTDKNQNDKKNAETVLTIGGFDVPYEVYRCAVLTQRNSYESKYGDNVWTGDSAAQMKEELEDDVLAYLKNLYAVLSLGEDYNISKEDPVITEGLEAKRESDIQEYGNEDNFEDALALENMNDSVYRFLTSVSLVSDELYYAMINAGDINTDKEYVKNIIESDEFIRVKQVLISDTNGKSDAENREKAEKVLALAREGKDFDELVSEYSEDLYMFGNTHGYYMIKGVWHKEFENAAFKLEIGEISDIIKTDSGYSIIKRYEKEDDYMEQSFDTLAKSYYDSVFSVTRENRAEGLEIHTTELYESCDILTME